MTRVTEPYRNALVILAIAAILGPLFGASFSLAMGRPTPHHIPAGLVGAVSTRDAPVAAALEAQTGGGLALHPYPSIAAAEQAIGEQRIYAALVLANGHAQLLVASAAGSSVARMLEEAAEQVSAASAGSISVVDVRPLPASDPQGLISFYVMLAATVTGFVTMLQLRAYASRLSLRAWLACIIALAAIAGLVLAVLIDPVIGALGGAFVELWLILAAMIAVAALWCSTMLAFVGKWAFVPTFGLLMVLGVPASGGAVAPPLLPGFYRFIDRFSPSGAAVEMVRNAAYFRHDQHLEPGLVLAAWIASLLAALVLGARFGGRTPGGQ
ncbi:MAG: rane protein [Frankiales bacterium]|nr:rane protein [Frankiales bacterium]